MKTLFKVQHLALILFILLGFLLPVSVGYAQKSPSGANQIDPDWEKIRDAQVQMLKKKELELDRLKEELLSHAQPQVGMISDEVWAELKKKEQAWTEQLQKYENEISLLRAKVEDQKQELDALRQKTNTEKSTDVFSVPVADSQALHPLNDREAQIQLQEKRLSEGQAKIDSLAEQAAGKEKELKAKEEELIRLWVDFEKQLSEFDKKIKTEQDRLEAERREVLEGRNAVETEKRVLSQERQELASQLQGIKEDQQKHSDLQMKEKTATDRERALTLKENELIARAAEAADREKRIADSQKQLVEERRQWQIERNQLSVDLEKRFAEADARLEKADTIDLERDRIRAAYEKQLKEVREGVQFEKDKLAQRDLEWKEKLSNAALIQSKQEQQIKDLTAKLSAPTGDSQKVEEQSRLLEQSIQKMNESEKEHQRLEAELSALKAKENQSPDLEPQLSQFRNQLEQQKQNHSKQELEWKASREAYEKQIDELSIRFSDQQSGVSAREQDLSQKLSQTIQKLDEAEKKRTWLESELTALKENSSSARDMESEKLKTQINQLQDELKIMRSENKVVTEESSDPELVRLRKELEAVKIENEDWRQSRRQVEKSWSEFVSRETQFQMEIAALKDQLARAASESGGRDWSSEGKRVVEERRALSDEKAKMYRQLTQDRQRYEQEQVEFLRRQREFESYINQEQAKLERLRRQVA